MHLPTLIKYLLLAWGLPVTIVIVARTFTPDPSRTREDFSQQSFRPERVWVDEGTGRKNSDHFELRIRNPEGEEFFHRDPEPEPIYDLYSSFPGNGEIRIIFSPDSEGNVLMEIVPTAPESAPLLSFETVMAEYTSRRRFVYIVAAIWCGTANLFAFALWKVDIPGSPTNHIKPKQESPSN